MRRLLLLVVMACGSEKAAPPPPPGPPPLAEYLRGLSKLDRDARTDEIRGWTMDGGTFRDLVVEPYAATWDIYDKQIRFETLGLERRFDGAPTVTTRAHYAGDPKLTLGQARARWALPVQYPSEVAELDGLPINVVFVRDGTRWRALTGIDIAVMRAAIVLEPACGELLGVVGTGECANVLWQVADAALREDRAMFGRACALAASLCVVNEHP